MLCVMMNRMLERVPWMSKPFAICAAKFLVSVLAVTLLASIGGARAESDRIVYAFQGGTDGAFPVAGLIVDKDGNFYGTTERGGSGGNGGTVFKLTVGGTETVLHVFRPHIRGARPVGSVILDKRGNLYGTTSEGGSCSISRHGCGTVFQLSPDGIEALLYSFQGGSDGAEPVAGLIAGNAGNLFGTASERPCCGTVFELAPDGSETVLHAFLGGSDGAIPFAGLIADTAGNLYGTTFTGGGTGCGSGCGTVFKLAPDGTETILHSFAGGNDGTNPWSAVIIDKAGNLYGTTSLGGTGCSGGGCGVVFRVAPDGTEDVLYSFAGGKDGAGPEAGLISDNAGNLYGTTTTGGAACSINSFGCGTVFKLTPDGHETVLHAFEGGTDGAYPESELVADGAGNLYGTTAAGGVSGCTGDGCGTVFSLRR